MKVCFKCKNKRPLTEFYAHPEMKDGRLNKCKECTKCDVKKHRFGPNREKILAYDRKRGNRQDYSYVKDYRKKNPEKYKAHLLARSIPKKPCEICGSRVNVHRHHHDYSKPKDVRFFCAEHHRQHHAGHF